MIFYFYLRIKLKLINILFFVMDQSISSQLLQSQIEISIDHSFLKPIDSTQLTTLRQKISEKQTNYQRPQHKKQLTFNNSLSNVQNSSFDFHLEPQQISSRQIHSKEPELQFKQSSYFQRQTFSSEQNQNHQNILQSKGKSQQKNSLTRQKQNSKFSNNQQTKNGQSQFSSQIMKNKEEMQNNLLEIQKHQDQDLIIITQNNGFQQIIQSNLQRIFQQELQRSIGDPFSLVKQISQYRQQLSKQQKQKIVQKYNRMFVDNKNYKVGKLSEIKKVQSILDQIQRHITILEAFYDDKLQILRSIFSQHDNPSVFFSYNRVQNHPYHYDCQQQQLQEFEVNQPQRKAIIRYKTQPYRLSFGRFIHYNQSKYEDNYSQQKIIEQNKYNNQYQYQYQNQYQNQYQKQYQNQQQLEYQNQYQKDEQDQKQQLFQQRIFQNLYKTTWQNVIELSFEACQLPSYQFQRLANNIDKFPMLQTLNVQMPNLLTLNFQGSSLQNLYQFSQSSLPNLKQLNLRQNFIKCLPFFSLPSLQKLYASVNKIQSIEQFALNEYPSLIVLEIFSNELVQIPQLVAPNLQLIQLGNNPIFIVDRFVQSIFNKERVKIVISDEKSSTSQYRKKLQQAWFKPVVKVDSKCIPF